MRIQPAVRRALDECGAPWEARIGGRHVKLFVAGRLAGILPLNGSEGNRRAALNCIAQIRRAAAANRA